MLTMQVFSLESVCEVWLNLWTLQVVWFHWGSGIMSHETFFMSHISSEVEMKVFFCVTEVCSQAHNSTHHPHSNALSSVLLQRFSGESGLFPPCLSQASSPRCIELCGKCQPLRLWHYCFDTMRLMLCQSGQRDFKVKSKDPPPPKCRTFVLHFPAPSFQLVFFISLLPVYKLH